MNSQQERWDQMVKDAPADTLEENVRRFFDILDTVECSDSGRDFKPIQISSCRVMLTAKLSAILEKMREQVYPKGL